jgi:hypothetical protein
VEELVEALERGDVEPGNVEPGDVEPGNVEPGHVEPGNVEPGNVEPGNVEPGNVEPGNVERGGRDAGSAFPLAALVMPATLEHIRLISEHGERMPAKSTYFYPKLLSGLVINAHHTDRH